MSSAAARGWRDSAALIALVEAGGAARAAAAGAHSDFEVLLQTRTATASFRNSVVFPGGVAERADGDAGWLRLLAAFGYSRAHLAALHRPPAPPASLPPLLQPDPLLRHLSLRITAIRETFEELGVLVCSRTPQHQRATTTTAATPITDFNIPHWQARVSENPEEFLSLCTELRCYPDVWALHWWSSWLTPARLPKRFHTAFFFTQLTQPGGLHPSSEVVKAEWARPGEVVSRPGLVAYPPQAYELVRLSRPPAPLAALHARARAPPRPLLYHVAVRAQHDRLYVFPGDDLYPSHIDYDRETELRSELTAHELREQARVAHRIEAVEGTHTLVFKNYDDMDLLVVPLNIVFS